MSPSHFWGSVLVIGPLGVLVAVVVFPPGRTALPNSAMASGIAGPMVLIALADLGEAVVVVVFLGGMAKPHVPMAIGTSREPLRAGAIRS